MTCTKRIPGYLNRLKRNIDVLDDGIDSIQKPPKGEKPAEKRARLKLLRDLVELQNGSLTSVKVHLLGRDATGAPNEPPDHYEDNDQIEFERYFKNQLAPWTEEDLKLECEDCGVRGENVYGRDGADLCNKCNKKRQAAGKILECEICHVKSEDVSSRAFPGTWAGDTLFEGASYNLCSKCWTDKQAT